MADFSVVDREIARVVDAGKAEAVTAAAVRDGQMVYAGAAGQAAGSAAAAESTGFMTASITKLMNAVLCMQLHEKGLLDLDGDICEPLGVKVRNPRYPDAAITVRHLLTHTSGLRDDEAAVNRPGRWKTLGRDCPVTLEEYVRERLVESKTLWGAEGAPGEAAYWYSNAGQTLVGWVIEKVSGKPLPALAQANIFDRLGMTRTKYTLAEMQALPDTTLAAPFGDESQHCGLAELPAAGMRSTAVDLAAFLQAFTSSHNPLFESEDAVQAMLPANFRTGLSWWGADAQYGNPKGGVWEHGGFMQGVRTHIYLYPKQRAGAVILCNGECEYRAVHEALCQCLSIAGP